MPVPISPSPLSRSALSNHDDDGDDDGDDSSPRWSPASFGTSTRRRRSSGRLSTSPTPNTLSLVGSYSESLLTGRMSTTPSRPFPFRADLGVLGQLDGETPRHLLLDFEARYYALPQGNNNAPSHHSSSRAFSTSASTASSPMVSPPVPSPASNLASAPYVASIDIEAYYHTQLEHTQHTLLNHDADIEQTLSPLPAIPPLFPGYEIPSHGHIQLLVKNPHLNTPVKLFLVPYDLRDMPRGTKTFIRQKVCVESAGNSPTPAARKRHSIGGATPSPNPKETLQHVVHMHFVALSDDDLKVKSARGPSQTTKASIASPPSPVRYFLHKSVRLVFSPTPTDKEQTVRTYIETPAGMRAQPSSSQGADAHVDSTLRLKEVLKKYMPVAGSQPAIWALAGQEWCSQRKHVMQLRKDVRRRRQAFKQTHRSSTAIDASPSQSDISLQSDGSFISNGSSSMEEEGDISVGSSRGAFDYSPASAVDICCASISDEGFEYLPNSDPDGERWFDDTPSVAMGRNDTVTPMPPRTSMDGLAARFSRLDVSSAAAAMVGQRPSVSNLHASRPGTPGSPPLRASTPVGRERSKTITPISLWRHLSDDGAAAAVGGGGSPLSPTSLTSRPSSPFALNAAQPLTSTVKKSVNGTLHSRKAGSSEGMSSERGG